MLRHPTPIADELESLSISLAARTADGSLAAGELQRIAERLNALARRAAPLERFHAELVAEAAEEELRQCSAVAIACDSALR